MGISQIQLGQFKKQNKPQKHQQTFKNINVYLFFMNIHIFRLSYILLIVA